MDQATLNAFLGAASTDPSMAIILATPAPATKLFRTTDHMNAILPRNDTGHGEEVCDGAGRVEHRPCSGMTASALDLPGFCPAVCPAAAAAGWHLSDQHPCGPEP